MAVRAAMADKAMALTANECGVFLKLLLAHPALNPLRVQGQGRHPPLRLLRLLAVHALSFPFLADPRRSSLSRYLP